MAELEPDIMEAIIANLHTIPLPDLVDATLQTLLSYDNRVWEEELKRYLAGQYGTSVEAISAASQIKFEPQQHFSTQNEANQNLTGMLGAQQVVPALEPQVVDVNTILNRPKELTAEQALKHTRSSMRRVLNMENFFQIPATVANPTRIVATSNDTLIAARFGWMLMVVRLAVRSAKDTYLLKIDLLVYILKDFKSRYCIFMIVSILPYSGCMKNFTRMKLMAGKNMLNG